MGKKKTIKGANYPACVVSDQNKHILIVTPLIKEE